MKNQRVIKFRVHCAGTGNVLAYEEFNTTLNWGYFWVDASLPEDERICKTLDYFKHPHPIGRLNRVQFTGLTDANGVDIYEGDIVEISEPDEDSCCGRLVKHDPAAIVYKNLQWMFDNKKYKQLGQKDWADYACLSSMAGRCDFKVIGNIYQNPELLNDQSV